ncbi:hypothetical protein O3M35_003440 [Rhynocoris fuscipes]|uniref:Major facilitator superfamily (MFS) profile domain-containing protein n=1 Tax=Rhynocoris fuscipes TaxID=488301 RepID=A0AAW1CK11_9HEMI
MDLGNALSPIPSSYASDAIGRKMTLIISAATNLLASVFVLIGTHSAWLYLARLCAGLGKGISFAVIPIYLAEVANVEIRGGLSTMFIGLLNIGMFYDYALGPIISMGALDYANLIIPVLFIITFPFFPESPYYLLMKAREGSAKNSLRKYRQVKEDDSTLEREVKQIQKTVENNMKNRGRFVDLWATPSSRRALLIISLLALFQRSSGISPTLAYSTVIMPKTGGGIDVPSYMIIFSFILVVANYIATPLVDKIGRKPLLIISCVSTAICTFAVSIYYFLERSTNIDVTSIQWIPYAGVLIFPITYSLGIGFIPSTLVGELFPINVKSYASSVSAIILAATSCVVNYVFYIVAVKFGPHYMFWFFTLAMIVATIFTHYYVFETKGKTFLEIEEILAEKTERSARNN